MKTIVAGSRTIDNREYVFDILDSYNSVIGEVVSGGAVGVDIIGEMWAKETGTRVKRFPANWKKHGIGAGVVRNAEMAEYADMLIAIWDGSSRGTANMIEQARNNGLEIRVHKGSPMELFRGT